jgi:hypothetical protein
LDRHPGSLPHQLNHAGRRKSESLPQDPCGRLFKFHMVAASAALP